MSKRKLKILTIEEKLQLIEDVEKNPNVKKKDLALKYGIPPNTLSTIMLNKEKILQHFRTNGGACNLQCKKIKISAYPDVEEALIKWYENFQEMHFQIPMSGALLREKALDFGKLLGHPEFTASSGWLERFKARHNIAFRQSHLETRDILDSFCEEWRAKLPALLSGYKAADIFNIDETGLFYKCVPQNTLMFKGELCSGGKLSKERLTVLVGANSDGSEKLPLLIVGKPENPCCFKNVKSLPVNYKSNEKAWITSSLFGEYVSKLDLKFHEQSRKVLLFVDNCPVHPNLKELKNIKLEFFPPNMTSKLQPAEQGIVRNLKMHYRKRLIWKLITDIENNNEQLTSISILDAIQMIFSAWQNDVSQETIANCFSKCGFFSSFADSATESDLNDEFSDVIKLFQEESAEFSNYVNVDSELITCNELCSEGIKAEVMARDEEEEDSSISIDDNVPTNADVSNAMSVVHRLIESRVNVPDDVFIALYKINDFIYKDSMNSKKQVKNYFVSHSK